MNEIAGNRLREGRRVGRNEGLRRCEKKQGPSAVDLTQIRFPHYTASRKYRNLYEPGEFYWLTNFSRSKSISNIQLYNLHMLA